MVGQLGPSHFKFFYRITEIKVKSVKKDMMSRGMGQNRDPCAAVNTTYKQNWGRMFQIVWLFSKYLFCVKEYIGFNMSNDTVE